MNSIGVNRRQVGNNRLRVFKLGLLALGAILLFLWLGKQVHTARTQNLDDQLRETVQAHMSSRLTWFMSRATQLGSTVVLTILSVIAVVLHLLLKWWRSAMLQATEMGGAFLLNRFLKDAFHRIRPEPFFGLLPPQSRSFPSGHAFCVVCFYGMLAVLLTTGIRSYSARTGVWFFASAIIAIVSLSRVYLGVHYPTDVVGGWAAGVAWVSVVLAFDKPEERSGLSSKLGHCRKQWTPTNA